MYALPMVGSRKTLKIPGSPFVKTKQGDLFCSVLCLPFLALQLVAAKLGNGPSRFESSGAHMQGQEGDVL